jgi:hypothetical protein
MMEQPRRTPGSDGSPGNDPERGGGIEGHPTNPDEVAPQEDMPDPPEGGNRQPREPDAVEGEPGHDL